MINVGDKWSRYEFLIGDRFGLLVTYLADFHQDRKFAVIIVRYFWAF